MQCSTFPTTPQRQSLKRGWQTRCWLFGPGYAQINPLPYAGQKKLICSSHGPGNIDAFLTREINWFLASPGGWYIFNTHGLDDEGWGPLSSACLNSLLARLKAIDTVEVVPTGRALVGL